VSSSKVATVLLYMVDPGEREALQSRLEGSGVAVRVIDGPASIAEPLPEQPTSVCFVEVKSGDAAGLAVIRQLRALDAMGAIVVLSSNRDMESRMAARDAGANDYLATPIRNIDLEMRLARCLADLAPGRPAVAEETQDSEATEHLASLAAANEPPLETALDAPLPEAAPPAVLEVVPSYSEPIRNDRNLQRALEDANRQVEVARALAVRAREEAVAAREASEAARAEAEAARVEAEASRALANRAASEMLEGETRTRQLQSQAHTLIEVAEARNAMGRREMVMAPSVSGESRESDVDELTGLLGEGPLQDHLDREYARSRRYGHALSVLLIDVDKLGRYSRRHTKAAGDAALCLIADVLRSALRSPDIVARPGSDAFAILATDTNEDEALLLGERLRKALAEEGRHGSWPAVTVSIGIASAQRLSITRASDLLVAAERAMSEAKSGGRDRCCIAIEA